MTSGVKRDLRQPGKLMKSWLIIALVLALALGGSLYLNISSGRRLDILKKAPYGSTLQNNKLIYSPELQYTFLGTYKDTILAVDSAGTQVWQMPTAGSVEAIRYDATRNIIIAGSQGRYVYVLNAADGSELNSFKVGGVIYDMDFDSSSGYIAVSAPTNKAKGQIVLYDMQGNQLWKQSTRAARGCRFSPDGQYIYYGDSRANLIKLDLEGNEVASTRLEGEIYALDIAKDTGELAVADNDGNVTLLDSELNIIFNVALTGNGRAVGISHDGAIVAAGTREGDVYILDRSGALTYSTRLSSAVSHIAFTPEKSYVVPLSTELYEVDVSAAEDLGMLTKLNDISGLLIYALPAALILALVLAFGKSRGMFIAFFNILYRHKVAYLLLLPSFALIIIFSYIPICQAFYYAFTDWNQASTTMRDVHFIGFDNFVKMITEGYFLLGVKNMLIMMLFNFLKLCVPLLLAELVFSMSGGKRRYWFRFLLVLPMVVPGVVSTLMWKNIYDPTIGLINQIFKALGHPEMMQSWLGSEATALGSIIFMGFPWVNSFAFLVFYGGLINIPGDLFEAARVDGSNPFWNLTRIHIPLITPQIKMIVILTFISSIQDYGSVLLLTNGGPGYATYVPGYELYLNATLLGQYGYACALGLVMFVAILGGTILNMRIKTEEALG